ncbi:MAG: VOC family protein [Alphaproteobacteria bacterium]|nr:VOC family protein [Alphaproteobacteria bacterium]
MSKQQYFNGVAQVGIVSADAPRLIAFYRDVMGFPVMFEAGGMTFIQAGATSLMVAGGSEAIGQDVILYFEPDDWNAAETRLAAAGVQFEREAQVVQREAKREHVLRPFRDPEGRRLYLLGWRPTA